MGIMVGLPSPSGSEKDLQLNFGKNMTVQVEMRAPHLPAEWHLQSGIQLTWPHAGTDWAYMLKEVQECFVNIAREIAKRELLQQEARGDNVEVGFIMVHGQDHLMTTLLLKDIVGTLMDVYKK